MDEELQMQFCGITAADPATAKEYLQVSDNDVERAIALFFENGGASLSSSNAQQSNPQPAHDVESVQDIDDEAMARRLQGEDRPSSQDDQVRAPIAPTRGVLMDDMMPASSGFDAAGSLFGRSGGLPGMGLGPSSHFRRSQRQGIFNQNNVWHDGESPNLSDDEELAEATGGASQDSSKANRLAHMFRPPFEMMTNCDLDSAKSRASDEKKWIMVNLQDVSDFQCQMLNRDLWKDRAVIDTVKANFLFLQFTADSSHGEQYNQIYPVQQYPHIAILDPRTGEQVRVWSQVLQPDSFLLDVHEFLDRYSLDPKHKNPVAKKAKTKVDVSHMSEDEQLNAAMMNSVGGSSNGNGDVMVISDEEEDRQQQPTESHEEASAWKQIPAVEHQEPPAGATSTRVQIRTPQPHDRIIRRFNLTDPVQVIFETIKSMIPEAKETEFSLVFQRKQLIEHLQETIVQAGLKSAALQMEFIT